MRCAAENVSSLEVAAEIRSHPAIAEVAVVGIPSEHGDEEILAAVVVRPATTFSPRELAEFLIPRLPHFAVPRYLRVVEELPKTPTNKIMKVEVRKQGVTQDTWDREAEGMVGARAKRAPRISGSRGK